MTTDFRKQRGQAIAETGKVKRMGGEWFVPSQSGSGKYIVCLDPNVPRCTCPDWELREMKCKHIFAVEYGAVTARVVWTASRSTNFPTSG